MSDCSSGGGSSYLHIVVAGGVFERRPEERLTAAAEKQHVRYQTAIIFALQRSNVRDGSGQHRPEALQALEVPSQTIGHRQRHHSKIGRASCRERVGQYV